MIIAEHFHFVEAKIVLVQNVTFQIVPVQNVPFHFQIVPVQNVPYYFQIVPVQIVPVQNVPVQIVPVQNVPVQIVTPLDDDSRTSLQL